VVWPYLVVFVLLGALLFVSVRNRKRAMADQVERAERIGVGTEVMTTSGLYGTVVAKHDDGTVLLSIAPGVEVKWAAAALRDAQSLADSYRRGLEPGAGAADHRDQVDLQKDSGRDTKRDIHKADDGS
jgi:preprotein translocase subunit YajC